MFDFVADLHRLAEHCEFGATLDEMLRDVFVIGINKETILRKLLVVPDLDLTETVSIATVCTTTDEELRVNGRERDSQPSSCNDVNKLSSSSSAVKLSYPQFHRPAVVE